MPKHEMESTLGREPPIQTWESTAGDVPQGIEEKRESRGHLLRPSVTEPRVKRKRAPLAQCSSSGGLKGTP